MAKPWGRTRLSRTTRLTLPRRRRIRRRCRRTLRAAQAAEAPPPPPPSPGPGSSVSCRAPRTWGGARESLAGREGLRGAGWESPEGGPGRSERRRRGQGGQGMTGAGGGGEAGAEGQCHGLRGRQLMEGEGGGILRPLSRGRFRRSRSYEAGLGKTTTTPREGEAAAAPALSQRPPRHDSRGRADGSDGRSKPRAVQQESTFRRSLRESLGGGEEGSGKGEVPAPLVTATATKQRATPCLAPTAPPVPTPALTLTGGPTTTAPSRPRPPHSTPLSARPVPSGRPPEMQRRLLASLLTSLDSRPWGEAAP